MYHYAGPSGLRDRKAPKDGQQLCFTPKDRCHLSPSPMAATIRLSRLWADVYRPSRLFTLLYRRHLPNKRETVPLRSYGCHGRRSLSCGCSPSLWMPNQCCTCHGALITPSWQGVQVVAPPPHDQQSPGAMTLHLYGSRDAQSTTPPPRWVVGYPPARVLDDRRPSRMAPCEACPAQYQ
jgi:hypothetical protein